MSYALSRRFGWVYVDAPRDTAGFITAYLRKEDPALDVPVDADLPSGGVLEQDQRGSGARPRPDHRYDQGSSGDGR